MNIINLTSNPAKEEQVNQKQIPDEKHNLTNQKQIPIKKKVIVTPMHRCANLCAIQPLLPRLNYLQSSRKFNRKTGEGKNTGQRKLRRRARNGKDTPGKEGEETRPTTKKQDRQKNKKK